MKPEDIKQLPVGTKVKILAYLERQVCSHYERIPCEQTCTYIGWRIVNDGFMKAFNEDNLEEYRLYKPTVYYLVALVAFQDPRRAPRFVKHYDLLPLEGYKIAKTT